MIGDYNGYIQIKEVKIDLPSVTVDRTISTFGIVTKQQ